MAQQVYQPLLPSAIQRLAGSEKMKDSLNQVLQQQMPHGTYRFHAISPAVHLTTCRILGFQHISGRFWSLFLFGMALDAARKPGTCIDPALASQQVGNEPSSVARG